MMPIAVREESDALRALAGLTDHLPGDYLIVGAHASYAYHHWLMPIKKMIELRVRSQELALWQTTLAPPWTVLTEIPTMTQIRSALRIALLEPALNDALYNRRRVVVGLDWISPEDCFVELLARAATQISLSECAALLVAQRTTLDWEYLAERATFYGLATRLRGMVKAINRAIEQPLLPIERINHHAAPQNSRANRRWEQLNAHLPPAIRPHHHPRISKATLADVLRRTRISQRISNG